MVFGLIALVIALCLVAVLLPAGAAAVLAHADRIGERLVAFARRCRLLRRPAPVLTDAPPIERIAADLRRLSAAIAELRRGVSAARRRGLQIAYDGKLEAACRALRIEQNLNELTDSVERELERLRIETALESAGLRFRSAVS